MIVLYLKMLWEFYTDTPLTFNGQFNDMHVEPTSLSDYDCVIDKIIGLDSHVHIKFCFHNYCSNRICQFHQLFKDLFN